MPVIHFSYYRIKNLRNTYHPPEEQRISREINRLKAMGKPFGPRLRYISQNTQVRIIETLCRHLDIRHPRLLVPANFVTRLPGWKAQLQGIYKHYANMLPKEQSGGRVIDYMLDHLGVQPLEGLPVAEQIKLLSTGRDRINWKHVNNFVIKALVELLAKKAGVPHLRMLTHRHFRDLEIAELGPTLIALYENYAKKSSGPAQAIDLLLDKIGVPKFDDQSWEQQLRCLKQITNIHWERIPATTQLKLVALLKEHVPQRNEVACPHVRALVTVQFKGLEIGLPLSGLHDYYRRTKPREYNGPTIDFMLDQLGVEKLEELPYEKQCLCLRYKGQWTWTNIPKETSLRFLTRVKELNALPHLRNLGWHHLCDTTIPEIGQSLTGLYTHYQIRKDKDDPRGVVDIILDHLGAEQLSKLPLKEQLKCTALRQFRWKRAPPGVIRHYIEALRHAADLRSSADLLQSHFALQVGGKETGLDSLFLFLSQQWRQTPSQTGVIGWALKEYGTTLQEQIKAKRRHGANRLDLEEKTFLIDMAQTGSREAMEHLLFFYRPIIYGCIKRAVARVGLRRKTYEELFQVGQIGLVRLIKRFERGGATFETYVIASLPWTISREIKGDTGDIHHPISYLDKMRGIYKTEAALEEKLGRKPSDEELAKKLEMGVDELRVKRHLYAKHGSSLQSPLFSDGDATLEDRIPDSRIIRPDSAYQQTELKELLENAIEGSGLNENEKFALRKHRLEQYTLEEVGGMLNMTRQRIKQLEVEAFKKIKKRRFAQALKEFIS
ncbi:MAG: sigma-70 family RNA polymerase sigma factor [Candidatus Margulisiibacteriota bacterium]|nr:sigma-70 family RNA polymerase sigma factor [Candidatus Margulisiibacteriota bacterium]